MPEVGAFGFVERGELDVLGFGESGEVGKITSRAVADFWRAFDADTEMPGIGGKLSLERREWRLVRTFFGVEEKLHEVWTDEFDGSRAERRVFDECAEGQNDFGSPGRGDEAAAGRRGRKSSEVEAGDHCESAERADKKLVKVVAGDVFDDAAAALAELAGAVDEFRANEEIAGGAVRKPKRRIDARSDDAADGGFEIERNGERKKLFSIVERDGEIVEIGAGIDAEREVAGIVVCDLVDAGHVEGEVVAGGRHADAEFSAIAAGDEGEFFESGETDDFGNFFGGGRFCDGGRREIVYGVFAAGYRVCGNVISADESFKA